MTSKRRPYKTYTNTNNWGQITIKCRLTGSEPFMVAGTMVVTPNKLLQPTPALPRRLG